jgi:adenine-specific DNA-methyltransferase
MSPRDAQKITAGEFGGAPEELTTFEVRDVETRVDQEAQNVEAYLDQMIRLIKFDGVRFPNNKEMKFSRLEPVLDGSVIHAEGRWSNGERDKDPDGKANVGVVFGPQYGPITAMQVEESIRQANRRGYDHLVLAGFSFDGESQAVIAEAQHPRMKIHAANIRPDVNPGMAGLLKEQPGSQLFTVFGQPRTGIEGPDTDGEYTVTMEGVDIYNPVDNSITPTKADKVAAWFLDGDYDGRTFCITQAFFPDKDAWAKLSKALDGVVDPDRFEALSGTTSLPFPSGKHKTVAVKVIDPRGNEVMSVHPLRARRG